MTIEQSKQRAILEELSAPFTVLALSLIELGHRPADAIAQAGKKCPGGEMAYQKLQRLKQEAAAARKR